MANISNVSRTNIIKNQRPISIDGIYSMFQAKRPPDFYFSGESHSAWEMVYICNGSVGVTADDKVYNLNSGDIIFHQPMQFHKIWCEDKSSCETFISSFYLEGEMSNNLRNGVFRLNEQQKEIMNIIITNLRTHFDVNSNDFGETDYIDMFKKQTHMLIQYVISLLEGLMMSLALSNKRTIPAKTGESEQLYKKIVGIIESKVYSDITIPEIANLCCVSSATVKKCFSSFTGCGIHKYLLKIKMRTAIELIQSGKNINEVSDMLNFANSNYFSYVFKRETGKCASSYK